MKCQFCNKNEADKVFYLDYMGGLYQISICNDCLQRMWQQAVATGQAETFRNYSGWWPGRLRNPDVTGNGLSRMQLQKTCRRKAKLSLLRIRLTEAANQEDYEEAARLRDNIALIEKEVCSHEG